MTELSPVRPASAPAASDQARKSAREFEAVFASQIAKLMVESVEVDESFGGGHGEEMFRGIMAEELGKAIADRGSFGLAPVVLDHILKLQGKTA